MHNIKHYGGLSLKNDQGGAVLILSMVILLIMTLIGTANMQSSGFQQKMATNAKARQEAFQVAESTLRFAEARFQNQYNGGISERNLILNCQAGASNCFESTCSDGLCFSGSLDFSGERALCQVLPAGGGSVIDAGAYLDKNIWASDDRHLKAVGILPSDDYESDPKYVIEFMCYVRKDASQDCITGGGAGCSPLFRVTALVERKGAAARVMLSSMFRVNQ